MAAPVGGVTEMMRGPTAEEISASEFSQVMRWPAAYAGACMSEGSDVGACCWLWTGMIGAGGEGSGSKGIRRPVCIGC